MSEPKTMKARARNLRRRQTDAERPLWTLLRDRRLSQMKRRRQTPIGPYIVDFLYWERRLVVECDGSQHADSERDVVRDTWLVSQNFEILRVWNRDVLKSRESVIAMILARCGLEF